MPLPSSRYASELQVALRAVREAAVLCQSVQQAISASVLEKKDRSPVTVADFGSQALVCRALHEAFANDPVIAEEDSAALRESDNAALLERVVAEVSALRQTDADNVCSWIDHGGAQEYSPRFWTLDPIDGTKGFLRSEQYAISLSLVVNGEVTLGVLGCPNLPTSQGAHGSLLYAIRGEGAHESSLSQPDQSQPIQVTATSDSSQARFCESVESGHSSHGDAEKIAELLGITESSVRLDSQAKYAVVGRGEADIYMRLPTRADYVEKVWDHAAGILVVQEAGGRVTDIHGNDVDFSHGALLQSNKGMLATNGLLHDQVLAATREILARA